LAEDSKGEKVEEIPEIVSPQPIRPEKERGGRIERKQRRRLGGGALGFRPEEDDGPDRWDPPVSGCEGARAGGCGCGLGRLGPGGEREGFGPTFGPKPKEDFLKLFQFKLFLKCNSIY
jgi:hypothetical protein